MSTRYSSTGPGEAERLAVQGARTAAFDHQLFDEALAGQARTGLAGLDIGCADGALTVERFDPAVFASVLGVDRNASAIAEAAMHEGHCRFTCIDIDAPGAEREIRAHLPRWPTDGFHVIFAGLSIHHMGDPLKALRTTRRLLAPGGALIVRSADDGLKVAYPDPTRSLDALLDATKRQPGISDREHGRKMLHQLRTAGFRDVSVYTQVTQTAGMSATERHDLFVESFAYRRNYFHDAMRAKVDRHLAELEAAFQDEGFFYLEMDLAAVGR